MQNCPTKLALQDCVTSRGQIMGIRGGLMKMIFSLDTRQLLGVHIIGEGATELIHIGQAFLI